MSTSTLACYNSAARNPRISSRKARAFPVFGSAAVAGLVLGCGWTVYTYIFAASVYPSLDRAAFDLPVANQPNSVAVRSASSAAAKVVVALSEPAPRMSVPLTDPSAARLSFDDRFAAAAPQGVLARPAPPPQQALAQPAEPSRQADASRQAQAPRQTEPPKVAELTKPKEAAPRSAPVQVAAIAPAGPPRRDPGAVKTPAASLHDMAQRAKAAVLSIASADRLSIAEKLWGKPPARGSFLSFASADTNVTGSLGSSPNPALGGSQPLYDRSTAVYDISAHTVYLPDGSKLEAHSGLGNKLDDPSSANIRMRGVTPPHLYELQPREALFHGVPALRLNPVGGDDAIYGRSGLLAHTFMLGPNGDSNGCVSFRDYNAFLDAYRNQGIKKLAVVARIE